MGGGNSKSGKHVGKILEPESGKVTRALSLSCILSQKSLSYLMADSLLSNVSGP